MQQHESVLMIGAVEATGAIGYLQQGKGFDGGQRSWM